MSDMMNVSATPHIRSKESTSRIMLLVIIALLPATGFGIYNFGYQAAILIGVTIATTVLTELVYEKLMKLPVTIGDLSAVVTGLLLGLNLPPSAPWWIAVIGGVFAIIFVKMLFGGLGQNFMNPALGARCFLVICFTARMTTFTYDGVSVATPLAMMRNGQEVNTWDMVVGKIPGCIGETSVIALLIGAVFLILFDVIDMRIPGTYLLTFVIFIGLFGKAGWDPYYLTAQLAGGGLMIGAFFMATDYATSPITPFGKIIFGIILGLLTGLFRVYSNSAEGVSYAIIISNLLVPLIERFTVPKCFGKGGENR
ncbi:MAG: RnfABCDGE type electron transport complex subunit D [Lachnospiraceae bacterium]|nr:RnfABCDGE type electron transport complex subunit D [Lachnospiraceae bacterium]MCR5268686.1 RnfABCDGE type electron transport complex subunit D [Lachnospiraceae bacterium]